MSPKKPTWEIKARLRKGVSGADVEFRNPETGGVHEGFIGSGDMKFILRMLEELGARVEYE